MSELIQAVQLQDPGSALVELFELKVTPTVSVYFHPGLEQDLSTVSFRDKEAPYTVRDYVALPMEIEGLEKNGEGPSPRPTITIANVLATFSSSLGGLSNDDLVGKTVVRRLTLKKYLVGEVGDASPPIEFPTEKFIIDRVAEETKTAVSFELASSFDLEGIQIPSRTVVGKYCSWFYQGAEVGKGGCNWRSNSTIRIGTTEYKAYFTIDDEPIVLESDLVSAAPDAWSSGTTYSPDTLVIYDGLYWRCDYTNTNSEPSYSNLNWTTVRAYTVWDILGSYTYINTAPEKSSYVEYNNTIWRKASSNSNEEPSNSSKLWVRGDVCGKLLTSCKSRFQFVPDSTNSFASIDKNTSKVLPFGAFPGSEKFR